MSNRYLYLLLTPLSLWVLNEIFIFQPRFFFVSLSFGLLAIVFSVWRMAKNSGYKSWLAFALPPCLFYLSLSLYSGIIVSRFWIQTIFVLNVWFVFFYLKNLYTYFHSLAPDIETKLRRLFKAGSFLSTFALAATFYGLPIFLSWNFGFLLLLFIAASFILFGQSLAFAQRADRSQKIFLLINVLFLAEFAGALFFLPLSYNTLGLLVALIFYLLSVFNDWRLENRLNFRNIKWPIIIVMAIIALILLSARWL